MEWFRKAKSGIGTLIKKDTPADLWVKCDGCKEVLYRKELARNFHVCEHCGHHFRIGANEYLPIYIGSAEAAMMIQAKLIKKVGDTLEDLFDGVTLPELRRGDEHLAAPAAHLAPKG